MNRSVGASIVALVIAAAGCDTMTGVGMPIPIARFRAEPYPFTFSSGMNAPARLVVRDAGTWQTVWTQINMSPVSPPTIDFAHEMVIVAALGSHSSGGYGILIVGAAEANEGGAAIAIRSSSPGPSCGTSLAFTQPVDLATMPRREGEVTFVEHSEVVNC